MTRQHTIVARRPMLDSKSTPSRKKPSMRGKKTRIIAHWPFSDRCPQTVCKLFKWITNFSVAPFLLSYNGSFWELKPSPNALYNAVAGFTPFTENDAPIKFVEACALLNKYSPDDGLTWTRTPVMEIATSIIKAVKLNRQSKSVDADDFIKQINKYPIPGDEGADMEGLLEGNSYNRAEPAIFVPQTIPG